MHLLGYRETVTYPIPSSQKPSSTRTKSSLDKPKIFPRNNFHQKLSPTPRIITSHSRFLLSLFLLPSLSLFLEGGKLKWGWMGTSPRYTGIYIMKFTVVGRRRGGRLPREPQPGRIENMRKKYSQDSGEPGRGGVCEFYILPGYRGRRRKEDEEEELSISPGEEFASRQAVYAETKMQIIVWRERPETILPHLPEPSGESRKGVYFSGCGTR